MIGGAAGVLPPTGNVGLEPLVLFLIIFLWTPPHFWALSLNLSDDHAQAGVPMLPVVAGKQATARQILLYCVALVPISLLPFALGFASAAYAAISAACGVMLLGRAFRLWTSGGVDVRAAHRLFLFSITYLFLLFASLLADHGMNQWSIRFSSPGVWVSIDSTAGHVTAEI